jgi:hypothetical protein
MSEKSHFRRSFVPLGLKRSTLRKSPTKSRRGTNLTVVSNKPQSRHFCLVVVLGLLLSLRMATPSSAQASWDSYENARFGYVVAFPRGWVRAAESDNGDGRVIRSRYRDVLTVWGGFAEFAPSGMDYPNTTLRQTLSDGWVESGVTPSGSIFYARLRRSSGQTPVTYAAFVLTYPKNRRSAMNATVTRISKTFAPPCTIEAFECN